MVTWILRGIKEGQCFNSEQNWVFLVWKMRVKSKSTVFHLVKDVRRNFLYKAQQVCTKII